MENATPVAPFELFVGPAGLLPCPFCGLHDQMFDEARETHGDDPQWAVYCVCCCMQGPASHSIEAAKAKWNGRGVGLVGEDA